MNTRRAWLDGPPTLPHFLREAEGSDAHALTHSRRHEMHCTVLWQGMGDISEASNAWAWPKTGAMQFVLAGAKSRRLQVAQLGHRFRWWGRGTDTVLCCTCALCLGGAVPTERTKHLASKKAGRRGGGVGSG